MNWMSWNATWARMRALIEEVNKRAGLNAPASCGEPGVVA
jgi:hypothetical protein